MTALGACSFFEPAPVPVPGLEARCADACSATAQACSRAECIRGCRFVLDKLVEREGAHVLACVARAGAAKRDERDKCGDTTFAECAVRTGPYLDGGPPPPRPPTDEDNPS